MILAERMRATIPGLATLSTIFALGSLLSGGCANRGMKPPERDGGPTGVGGRGGQPGTGGGAGFTAAGGRGGNGGVDAGCPAPSGSDGGADAGACTAKYNFESSVHGATIAASGQAFTAVATSAAYTFCGAGALAIEAAFTGTSGSSTRGVVQIPVSTADMDFTGKTVTVRFMAVPGCSPDLGIAVALQTDSGDKIILPTFRPVTSTWKTQTVALTGDAGVAGMDTVRGISVQAFSSSGYTGTIYVDEIAVTGP
jgi:hypothetical protein